MPVLRVQAGTGSPAGDARALFPAQLSEPPPAWAAPPARSGRGVPRRLAAPRRREALRQVELRLAERERHRLVSPRAASDSGAAGSVVSHSTVTALRPGKSVASSRTARP